VDQANTIPERTVAAPRAGLALRGSREDAAKQLFALALELGLSTGDELLDTFEEELRHLQRTRRRGLRLELERAA
jgi:hypothetical protein